MNVTKDNITTSNIMVDLPPHYDDIDHNKDTIPQITQDVNKQQADNQDESLPSYTPSVSHLSLNIISQEYCNGKFIIYENNDSNLKKNEFNQRFISNSSHFIPIITEINSTQINFYSIKESVSKTFKNFDTCLYYFSKLKPDIIDPMLNIKSKKNYQIVKKYLDSNSLYYYDVENKKSNFKKNKRLIHKKSNKILNNLFRKFNKDSSNSTTLLNDPIENKDSSECENFNKNFILNHYFKPSKNIYKNNNNNDSESYNIHDLLNYKPNLSFLTNSEKIVNSPCFKSLNDLKDEMIISYSLNDLTKFGNASDFHLKPFTLRLNFKDENQFLISCYNSKQFINLYYKLNIGKELSLPINDRAANPVDLCIPRRRNRRYSLRLSNHSLIEGLRLQLFQEGFNNGSNMLSNLEYLEYLDNYMDDLSDGDDVDFDDYEDDEDDQDDQDGQEEVEDDEEEEEEEDDDQQEEETNESTKQDNTTTSIGNVPNIITLQDIDQQGELTTIFHSSMDSENNDITSNTADNNTDCLPRLSSETTVSSSASESSNSLVNSLCTPMTTLSVHAAAATTIKANKNDLKTARSRSRSNTTLSIGSIDSNTNTNANTNITSVSSPRRSRSNISTSLDKPATLKKKRNHSHSSNLSGKFKSGFPSPNSRRESSVSVNSMDSNSQTKNYFAQHSVNHHQRLNNNHSNDGCVLPFSPDPLCQEFNGIDNDDDKSTIYKHEFNSTRKEILDYRELVFTLRCIKPFNLKVINYKKKRRMHYGSRLLLHHYSNDLNGHYMSNEFFSNSTCNRRRHSHNNNSARNQNINLATRSASFSASSSTNLNQPQLTKTSNSFPSGDYQTQDTMNPFNSLGDPDFKRHLYGLIGSSSLGDIYDSSNFDSSNFDSFNILMPIPMISESQQNQKTSFASSTCSTNSTQTQTASTVSNIFNSYSSSSTTNRRRKSSIVSNSNYNNSNNRKNSTFSISNSVNSVSTSINSNDNIEINLHKNF
ncbi:hypothetical protein BVG19_g5511 [[Candida] boidinii]|nr:hypothetical protein BVG19_g5511 [[Candida] boidinii]OWB49623.1 hypothetical protein B5S27_g1164 [[Candida] boidinii]